MRKISVKAALGLVEILWPEFIEVGGAILLRGTVSSYQHSWPANMDLTGLEASENHTHIVDIVAAPGALRSRASGGKEDFYNRQHPDFLTACEFGKKLAEMWFAKLRQDFPKYRFRVYYTEEDNPIVRFHRVREGEPFWLDEAANAEDVAIGKVIVHDTGA